MHVVSATAQQFTNVSDHVRIAINAQHASSLGNRLLGLHRRAVERSHRVIFRFVRVKQLVQMGQLQNLADMLGNIAQLQVAAGLARAGQGAHHGSQAAAVNEHNVAEMQDDGAPVTQQPCDMSAQRLALAAGDDASLAADNGDASHFARFER